MKSIKILSTEKRVVLTRGNHWLTDLVWPIVTDILGIPLAQIQETVDPFMTNFPKKPVMTKEQAEAYTNHWVKTGEGCEDCANEKDIWWNPMEGLWYHNRVHQLADDFPCTRIGVNVTKEVAYEALSKEAEILSKTLAHYRKSLREISESDKDGEWCKKKAFRTLLKSIEDCPPM